MSADIGEKRETIITNGGRTLIRLMIRLIF